MIKLTQMIKKSEKVHQTTCFTRDRLRRFGATSTVDNVLCYWPNETIGKEQTIFLALRSRTKEVQMKNKATIS